MHGSQGRPQSMEITLGAAWRNSRALFALSATSAGILPLTGATLAICAAVGNPDPFLLRTPTSGVCRARGCSRAHSLERWEASRDLRHDGVLSALGATAELAGNGANVPDQLGSRVSIGGMVCAMGLGAPGTARGRSHRGGRDSLGTRLAGGQLSDRHLPDRHAVPTLAMGGTAALASHAAAGAEGPGGQKQESSTAAQAYALAPPTPRQSGARASPAKAECPARQQTGHRTGLGLEGDLLPFLEVQIRDVGRRLSRLLVLPGHAEPPGADEKGGPHAARP